MFKGKEKKKILKKSGFTLIETIIYVALISMVVSTFIFFGLRVVEIRNKNYVAEEVQVSARNVIDFLTEAIKQSLVVVSPGKGDTRDSLELDLESENDNLIFSVTEGALEVTLGSNSAQFINSRETSISNLEFSNFSSTGEKDSIKIRFTIEFRKSDSKDFSFSKNFETSVSLSL